MSTPRIVARFGDELPQVGGRSVVYADGNLWVEGTRNTVKTEQVVALVLAGRATWANAEIGAGLEARFGPAKEPSTPHHSAAQADTVPQPAVPGDPDDPEEASEREPEFEPIGEKAPELGGEGEPRTRGGVRRAILALLGVAAFLASVAIGWFWLYPELRPVGL